MNVIWLRLARQDLEEIQSYYSEVAGKSVADKILNKIIKASRLLENHPYIGHISTLDNTGNILEWVIPNTNYTLPYPVVGDDIIIYRVFDLRQEPIDKWD